MPVDVGTHDEALPEDAEAMRPTRRVRFRTGKLVNAGAALAQLTTPRLFPMLHPLITRVEEQPVRVAGAARIWDFTVHESVPVLGGLLRVPNRYRGRMALDPSRPNTARVSAWSAPGVRIEGRYSLVEDAIDETSWISAPWWVEPFVFRTFVEAHRRTLAAFAVAAH